MKSFKIFSILFCLLALNSCTKEFGFGCIQGNGSAEVRSIQISNNISKIEFAVPGTLYIEEGVQNFEIEGPSDVLEHIIDDSEVSGEKYSIKMDRCYKGEAIIVRASLDQIKALIVSGSGNIVGTDTFRNIANLDLEIAGSGNINVNMLDADRLDVLIAGSGNIKSAGKDITTHEYRIQGSGDIDTEFENGQSCRMRIEGSGNIGAIGSVVNHVIEIEGSGNVSAFALCAETCAIRTQGSGNSEVKVSNTLNVKIEGSGDVCYRGQPAVTLNIDGSGTVKSCN